MPTADCVSHPAGHPELAVGVQRVAAKIRLMLVPGESQSRARTRQQRSIEEVVVFQEPGEDTGQHPAHSRLGDHLIAPRSKGSGRAPGPLGGFVLSLEPPSDGGVRLGSLPQIVFQAGDQALQVGQKLFAVDHR